MKIYNNDNLVTMEEMKARGDKFDLIEIDGPYGAGLEGWDILTESEYIEHYTQRLSLVSDLLQPWGSVFLFGWPEMTAEIKAAAHRDQVLFLRRWISWFVNSSAHAARKIQAILFFVSWRGDDIIAEFRQAITEARKARGLTVVDCHKATGIRPYARGGYIWFESDKGKIPNPDEYRTLKEFFGLPDRFDVVPSYTARDGLTNFDVIRVPPERAEKLNDDGLRSKPIQLYWKLFKPVIPPNPEKRALILYGGSGNAGIAAEALGFQVSLIEASAERCEIIKKRSPALIKKWAIKAGQMELFSS